MFCSHFRTPLLKNVTSYLILALICIASIHNASAQGVQFFEGTWNEALEAAQEQRKLIFVDAYTMWCGPCKMMDRNVYPDSEVGQYYNEHFINVKMDMERGEGYSFASKYNVTVYPTLLFINHEGAQIYRDSAYKSPQQMLSIAMEAQDPEKNLALLELEFDTGDDDRDPRRILDYALLLKELGKDFRKPARQYFATLSDKELLEPQNWEAIKTLTFDINSREFRYLIKKKKKFSRKFNEREVEEKIADVLKKSVLSAAIVRDRDSYSDALKIAIKEVDDDGATAQRLRMAYTAGTREWEKYAFRAIDYFEKYSSNDAEELTQAAYNFYRYISDSDKLNHALIWIRQANAIESTFERQYTYAGILHKLGRWDEAMKYAYQSLNMARAGVGTEDQIQRAHELLHTIQAAKK